MDKHVDLSTEETYFTSKHGDLARNHGKTRLEQSQKQMQKHWETGECGKRHPSLPSWWHNDQPPTLRFPSDDKKRLGIRRKSVYRKNRKGRFWSPNT